MFFFVYPLLMTPLPDEYYLPLPQKPPHLMIYVLAILISHFFYHATLRSTEILTKGFNAAMKKLNAGKVPTDPETLAKDYRLAPKTTLYACCPVCFHLYPLDKVRV